MAVVFLEDDISTRGQVAGQLSGLGLTVLTEANVKVTTALYNGQIDAIVIALHNLSMAGAALKFARMCKPDLPFIIITDQPKLMHRHIHGDFTLFDYLSSQQKVGVERSVLEAPTTTADLADTFNKLLGLNLVAPAEPAAQVSTSSPPELKNGELVWARITQPLRGLWTGRSDNKPQPTRS